MVRDHDNLLSASAVEQLVSSMTDQGRSHLEAIQVERLLNALTRYQTNVPTGLVNPVRDPDRKI